MSAEIVRPWYNASSSQDGTCIDTQMRADGTVELRNSTDPDKTISATRAELAAFVQGAKDGKFDW